MKFLFAIVVVMLSVPTLADVPPGLANAACESGMPWRVVKAPGESTPETPIRMDMSETRVSTVCNCTAPIAGKNTGVTLNPTDNLNTSYLPSGACVSVASKSLIIRSRDSSVETWGTHSLEKLGG